MRTLRTITETRAAIREARAHQRCIALVPTMGALHAGHLSLVHAAQAENAAPPFVVLSIFVNPTQFAPHEDLTRYPRPIERDLALCENAGVAAVFLPTVHEMYPPGAVTHVHVSQLTDSLCGPHRPGHFDGVCTVVSKLLNIVQPDAAYFGEKDFQQLRVLQKMVRDLDLPIRVVGVPLMREPDGVALSSRNVYLSDHERKQARLLYQALQAARSQIRAGEHHVAAITATMVAVLTSRGPVEIDYAALVDPATLQPVTRAAAPVLVALAVRVGTTRLIDNLLVPSD